MKIVQIVLAVTVFCCGHSVQAFSVSSLSPLSRSLHNTLTQCSTGSSQLNLYKSVQEAIEEAQQICAQDPNSEDCKVAWDIVEELEAADSDRRRWKDQDMRQSRSTETGADLDALLDSFDILVRKINRKMDQLQATTDKMQQLGATDPAVSELGERAQTMKEHLEYVRQYLRS